MINIIQNDTILNSNIRSGALVFCASNNINEIKLKFIDKDILVTTITSYANKLMSKYSNYKLIDNKLRFIYMYKAFNSVKLILKRYNNVDNMDFINELCKTYSKFYEYDIISNDKTMDLKIIYEKYNELLKENFLMEENDIYNFLIDNISKIDFDYIYFDKVRELNQYQIDFVNKLKEEKNVILYANTINNRTLLEALNKINFIDYEKCANEDIENLYKLDSKELFSNINVVGCNDLYEEIIYVSNDINKSINNGLKYKDIMIISSDTKRYNSYFELLLSPVYSKNNKKGILTKLFINNFKEILINKDFSCERFINILKLNLFNIDENIISEIDNYVYIWNLEKDSFYKEFIYNPFGKINFNENSQNKLEQYNNLKNEIINSIRILIENVINENEVSNILRYLFDYLEEEGICNNLLQKDEEGYNNLVDVFEFINDNFKESNIDEVLNLIETLIDVKEEKIETLDSLKIYSLGDYNNEKFKKVYFIGVTEKDIPNKITYNSLLNNNDITEDSNYELIIKNKSKEENIISNILLNENVIITYHKLNDEKSKVNKSVLLEKFKNNLSFKFVYNKPYKNDLNNKIESKTAKELYGKDLFLSPSSIEVFSKCKYSYFLSYGLKLNVKEKLIFDNREVGTFVHYLLENAVKNNVTKDNIRKFLVEYEEKYFKDNIRNINKITKYVIKELISGTDILYNLILDELSNTKFKPKYTEFKIKDIPLVINLDDGSITIKGIVDRIDTFEDDNNYYYRIIDYKTGDKKFRLDDVLIGLNMQMLIYLLAIKNSNITKKNIIPTGFLYHHALIKYNKELIGTSNEDVIKNIRKEIRMNGILNKDYLNLYNEQTIGDFIDVKSRNNISEEKVLSTDNLNIVFDEIIKVIKEKGNEILSGDIQVNPIIDGHNNSCDYCKFSSICKFNKELDKSRKYSFYSNSEVIKKIEGDNHGMD